MPLTKPELRKDLRARLSDIPLAQRQDWSAGIGRNVGQEITALRPGRAVMVFASLPTEPDLEGVYRRLMKQGVGISLPRVDWANGTMEAALIGDWDQDLVADRHGLRGPADRCSPVDAHDLAAVLVPGLAFDRCGNRLGRGAGFYDRFLSRPDLRALRIGIAFQIQVVERVPMDPHDVAVHRVLTECEIIVAAPAPK